MLNHLQLPTQEETVAVQSDLDALCRDRELVTNEIFAPNAFYGQDFVLKRYAELSEERPLYCVIPHGADMELTLIWTQELKADLPAILCYSEIRQHVYQSGTRKVVIPSASPYVYVTRLLDETSVAPRRGTIFFLSHSTHHLIVDEETETLAQILTEVEERWRPVTICVYWKDLLLGRHLPFLERGFKVVSAGHMYDPLFLFRLHHLCSLHEYSTGDKVGSHVFYSVHSGCKHVYFAALGPPPPFGVGSDDEANGLMVTKSPSNLDVPNLQDLFLGTDADHSSQQSSATGYFLGYEWALSSEDLGEQLRGLERLDHVGYWRSRRSGSFHCFPPTICRRLARRAVRPLLRNRLIAQARKAARSRYRTS